MNCCDEYGNCNQGRDCPVRGAKVAKVAKVKNRTPLTFQKAPAKTRHTYLKHLAKWMLICIAAVMLAALSLAIIPRSSERVIDCALAEISPDFTPAMREACRKVRHA